jgi:hypothetical protein|tara:strand:- start:581 stop:1210 length:630 start_codon:yes stop_codon:yes gene_type:complete
MKLLTREEVLQVLENSPAGDNTKFLRAADSLWFRFHNYEKTPPIALEDDGIVSMIFATFNRDGYTNLYEIVTVQGKEGKGYASKVWDEYLKYAVDEKGSTRLKISCTPSSLGWHVRNGLIFWSVDPSGSIRSDQPLFRSREEQCAYRDQAIQDPVNHLPPPKQVDKFLAEDWSGFGSKKKIRTQEAIDSLGPYWLRPYMKKMDLSAFFA